MRCRRWGGGCTRRWCIRFLMHWRCLVIGWRVFGCTLFDHKMKWFSIRKNRRKDRRRWAILTPPKSANPLMPSVSANDNSVDICSSNTFTSPEYMNVSSATTAPNDAPGITITGWNGGSIVRNNSEKNELHALNTTRCARTVRPSADNVTSVRCDWSNNSGNDVSKLDCHAHEITQEKRVEKWNRD